jgi:fumarate hydratase class I
MFKEVNTATNLPAQIDLYATPGDYYKFLFMAKVGRRRARAALRFQTFPLLTARCVLPPHLMVV